MAGHTGVFTEDVPECDVDGADDVWRELGDALFVAEVEGFPVAVDLAGVLADEEGFDGGFEVGLEGPGASGEFGVRR